MNVYQKLIEVRKSVPYLQKISSGAQYQYVGSSQVLASLKEKMDELQLLLIPKVTGHKVSESIVEQHEKDTNNVTKRTTTYFTEIDMTMTWVNAEDPKETIECPWYGQGVDISGEKGVGKALTYAEKYFMLKFFNIPTDKDDPDSFQAKHDDKEPMQNPKTDSPKYTADSQSTTIADKSCSECGNSINHAIQAFSEKKFGKALCMNCQKKQSQGAK
ncbi:MAG: ERF family protein [Desulfosporosinus sp.]|nr:ERF family protein [Desulfosporosinus sp.]